MSFEVSAAAYSRFMGSFSEPLAAEFVQAAELAGTERALDVGAGTGALTAQLVPRLGAAAPGAIDPLAPFVEALAHRFPEVGVRLGVAEHLPWPAGHFDVTLAQLVVHFLADPVAGLREMARVTRPGGRVAACVWDHAGGGGPLSTFWRAVHDLDPDAVGEADLPGTREGHLAELFRTAGLRQVESSRLEVQVAFADFTAWWEPYLLGVGPAGSYLRRLGPDGVTRLRSRCAELLPAGPFAVRAVAWSVRARAAEAGWAG